MFGMLVCTIDVATLFKMLASLHWSTKLGSSSIRLLLNHTSRYSRPVTLHKFLSTQKKVSFCFIDNEGQRNCISAAIGETLLDVAHDNDIELEGSSSSLTIFLKFFNPDSSSPFLKGACGGELACSTCHLIFEKEVYDALPEVSEEEEDMLDLAWGLTET